MVKPFDHVLQPDARFASMVRAHDLQPMTFADHYADIDAARLATVVSGPVYTVFERARAAYLYSWFSYDLTTLAQGHACAALELALCEHLKQRYPHKIFASLNACLEKTIADGEFRDFRLAADLEPCKRAELGFLRELLVLVRNDISHGTDMVMMPSHALDILIYCARLIDHVHARGSFRSD